MAKQNRSNYRACFRKWKYTSFLGLLLPPPLYGFFTSPPTKIFGGSEIDARAEDWASCAPSGTHAVETPFRRAPLEGGGRGSIKPKVPRASSTCDLRLPESETV